MGRIKKTKALFILLCIALDLAAQEGAYKWQSPVSGLNGAGYYRLLLTPDVRSRSDNDGADLRLVDSSGNYVPYLLKPETVVNHAADMTILPVTSSVDARTETIIIENKNALTLSELQLTLRNKAQGTAAQMSGSDDGEKWFDINTNIYLSPSAEMHADTFEQTISFPPVRYKNLRLTIKARRSIPVNIIKAAVVRSVVTSAKYSIIPLPTISQKDSTQKSYITLDYKEAYTIDRLILNVSGARLYHRQVEIYTRIDTGKWIAAGNGLVSSAGENSLTINAKTRQLLLVIENEDNKPLHIESVQSLQLNLYLISYLDGDRNYFLVFGNSKAKRPSYDLAYFEDSIRHNVLKDISSGNISSNTIIPNMEPAKKATGSKGLNKWWIWPMLTVILGVMLYFTITMSRDIASKV